ncbi:MAG: CBS domain-containing protein [Nitrospirae bacterium]|nr:CBS domain-containing protein [Nitrospirota bacterium]
MPIVLSVNGIVETYPVKPVAPRHPRVESVETQGEPGQRPASSDRSVLAAQTAYQQQTSQEQHPKPARPARDLMTTPVLSLPSDSTLTEARTMMTSKSFRHIPVTSVHSTLVGMVSDRDLLHHVPELITMTNTRHAAQRRLAEIMTARIISATPTTDVREIARVMLNEQIHAIPILDIDRRLVGILTTHDLLRGIANHGPIELWT